MGGQVLHSAQKPVLQLLDQLKLNSYPLSANSDCYSLFCGSGPDDRPVKVGDPRKSWFGGGLSAWMRALELSRVMGRLRSLALQIDPRHPYSNRQ